MSKGAMDNNMHNLDMIIMTWIMFTHIVIQAGPLPPDLPPYPIPSLPFNPPPHHLDHGFFYSPPIKNHYRYERAKRYCQEVCQIRCEFHFKRYPAIYKDCCEKCVLPCIRYTLTTWPHWLNAKRQPIKQEDPKEKKRNLGINSRPAGVRLIFCSLSL